ncbi:MAG: P-loop NTPase [Clostridia bacterium]|nr:P-loop NTPase [Clostridia bacterium]
MSDERKKIERIWLTPAKGGVGVGFASVNLALALCRRGKRVLLVDGSVFGRSLDTVLSCAEDVIYDIGDLAAHRVEMDKTLLRPLGENGPALLPAAFSGEDAVTGQALSTLLSELSDTGEFDYILVDALALTDALVCAKTYDRVLVVTDPTPASLRSAEMRGVSLRGAAVASVSLLINRFSLLPPRESGQDKAILMMDQASLPLLGIIPTVGELSETAHKYVGKYPLLEGRAFRAEPALAAFDNLAGRLLGEEVPLLSNIRAVRSYRRKLLY